MRSRTLSLGSALPTAMGSDSTCCAATSRSLHSRNPARVAVKSTANAHLCRSDLSLAFQELTHDLGQLLHQLRRQEPAQELHAFGHGLFHVALDRHLVVHQLEGSQEERLELGHLRNDTRPAHDVVGAQNASRLPRA